jgi:hypothetical protein
MNNVLPPVSLALPGGVRLFITSTIARDDKARLADEVLACRRDAAIRPPRRRGGRIAGRASCC